ncbi:metallophosphoesterase [Verrucomicrobiales bacterium]|nr:metallophosphoesterase [Verrucomicrobiales bacterium]
MTRMLPPDFIHGYDVIGDIHGYAEPLKALLEKLDYEETEGSYSHPEGRKVVFLGDFIDRGPAIRETLHLVRAMTDAGNAVAVMGNHEFNAVCFHTSDGNGDFLRSHLEKDGKNVEQHKATLDAFAGREDEWEEWISWFKQLPFSLDLGGIRAVHAAWSAEQIDFLNGKSLNDLDFLHASTTAETEELLAVETVLKGIEVSLPEGNFFSDKQGFERADIRVRWWEAPGSKSFREVVFPDCDTVSDDRINFEKVNPWKGYGENEPPVFFGHYWLPTSLEPHPVAPNAACLDYSVARPDGKLVAYRWDGESRLDSSRFVSVAA